MIKSALVAALSVTLTNNHEPTSHPRESDRGTCRALSGSTIVQKPGTVRSLRCDLDITRHCISLIQLGDNLISNNETVDQLRSGIDKAQQLDFNILDEVMINHLANLYRNSISHLSPRIVISGQQQYLNNELVAAKIRASLLAGLRSVVLWRQCGGTRPGLLLSRSKYMRVADAPGVCAVNDKSTQPQSRFCHRFCHGTR